MPTRRPSPEHQEAVARRLALLSAELSGARPAREPGVLEDARSVPGPTPWSDGHTRIRPPSTGPASLAESSVSREAGPPGPAGSPGPPAVAPLVPVPGRHASRRRGRGLAGTVPETLRGRVALGPPQLTVVALLVALGLAVTCWWVVRSDAHQVEAPTLDPAAATVTPTTPLVDASPVAAGASAGASGSGAPAAVPTPGAPGGPLVNLNTASQSELEALPQVGPVTAQAILAWRDQHGGFSSVDELLEVDGIGDATLGQLAPFVTV